MLKMTMIGNLGRDAEVREVNGQKVISFPVAHTERYTDRSGVQQEKTTWVNCSYWRQDGRTGVAEYLKKGKQVYVEGMPSARAYTNNSGEQVGSLELRVMNLELVGGRGDEASSGGGSPRQQAYPQPQQPARPAEPSYSQGGYTPQAAPMDAPVEDDLPF